MQILTLALHSPAEKQHNSLSWWSLERGACAPSGHCVPCGSLVSGHVTDMEEDYGLLDSRDGLGNGFASWILMDILDALDMYLRYASSYPDNPEFSF